LESILRVYNLFGRRDNKYKARIKILVQALGIETFRDRVEEDWEASRTPELELTDAEIARVSAHFMPPAYEPFENTGLEQADLTRLELGRDRDLGRWVKSNVVRHRAPGYAACVVSVKRRGVPPGDVTSDDLDALADLQVAEARALELREVDEQLGAIVVRLDEAEALVAHEALDGTFLSA
jgi:sulfite reductase (NADPH) hemoprotein beta-component